MPAMDESTIGGGRRGVAMPTSATFPFNTLGYAEGLSNIGAPETDPSGRLVVLRRAIAGTELSDGTGPWPYLWIDGPADLESLRTGFPDLVSLVAVTQPGFRPELAEAGADAIFLKDHFVYDPARPTPPLSVRTRKRLHRAEAEGTFDLAISDADRMAIVPIYRGLLERRGLTGSLFDFPAKHFAATAALPGSVFFRVANRSGIGAMACGIVYGDMLQILHTAIAEDGLAWNASYLLMHGMQGFARDSGLRLLTGGMPAGAAPGLRTFKLRWANAFAPVYLVRIVNDRKAYDALSAARGTAGFDFFPAYRAPSG